LPEIVQDIGAYAGLASVVGLAVLSVLYFSQARDVKRLREWAGRAPEREAEQVAAAQATPGRVVAQPQQKPAAATPAQAGSGATPAPAGGGATPAPALPAAAGAAPAAATAAATAAGPAGAASGGGDSGPKAAPGGSAPATTAPKPEGQPPAAKPAPQPAAAKPSDSKPAAQPSDSKPAAQPADSKTAAQPAAPKPAAPPVPGAPRPAAATAAAARTGGPPPPPPPPAGARTAPGGRPVPEQTAVIPPRSEPWHQRLFGSTRNILLAVAGVLLLGAGAALALTQLSDDEPTTSSQGPQAQQRPPAQNGEEPQNGERRRRRPAIDPSSVTVAVLNGTTVPGLAARVSDEVQSAGFEVGTVANSSDQQRAESVILFSPGHEREAAAVSRRLDIAQREPIDPATQGLAGDATVVVVTGADRS
jgi:LytR cell envelope-related transcriptional attenuator